MSPYLITILVLVIMSADRWRAALNAPAALGQNFHASTLRRIIKPGHKARTNGENRT